MIARLGRTLSRVAARWVPDPFVLALALTFLTLLLAVALTDLGVAGAIGAWGGRLQKGELLPQERGLFALLAFGMQMCLVLVTGHALAEAPAVRRLIGRVASLPKSPGAAIAMTALVAMGTALVHWGLGLVTGALLAREVAVGCRRRGIRVHYPLLGAAGYTGLMVWHGGLSGSAPLKVTQAKDLAEVLGRTDVLPIPLSETLFSPMNLALTAALLVAVPILLVLLTPRDPAEVVEVDPDLLPASGDPGAPVPASDPPTPAERLERSRLLAWATSAAALAYLFLYLGRIGLENVDLNAINLGFLAVGLALHGSAAAYAGAIAGGARSCAGILLQFPFYAGIMGIMALSGLVAVFSDWIALVASESTFAPLTFLAAGFVNLFVPSGGGQWAVQGPIVMASAETLGVPFGKAVMALAYGDEWTNMLQPFWALPLLGITGLAAKDLIGYTAAVMLLAGPLYLAALYLG